MKITKKYIPGSKNKIIGNKDISVTFFPDCNQFMIGIGTSNPSREIRISDHTFMWINQQNYSKAMQAIREMARSYDPDCEYEVEFNGKTMSLGCSDDNVFIRYWGEVCGTYLCIPKAILSDVVDFISSFGGGNL